MIISKTKRFNYVLDQKIMFHQITDETVGYLQSYHRFSRVRARRAIESATNYLKNVDPYSSANTFVAISFFAHMNSSSLRLIGQFEFDD
jgi:hypothetical protein